MKRFRERVALAAGGTRNAIASATSLLDRNDTGRRRQASDKRRTKHAKTSPHTQARRRRDTIGSVELDQVLKDQGGPSRPVSLHERSALRQLAELHGREA